MGVLENGLSFIKKFSGWFYRKKKQEEMLEEMLEYHHKAEARAVERIKEDAERKQAEINRDARDLQQQTQIDEILKEVSEVRNNTLLLRAGVQKSLMYILINRHKLYSTRGYCSILEKKQYEESYNAYHALHENGVIDGLYEEVMNLPNEEPESSKED